MESDVQQEKGIMSKLLIAFGGGAILMGLFILLSPEQFVSLLDWESRTGQYVAAAIRVVTGLILLLGASTTRYPTGFRIFGGLVLLIGLTLPIVPIDLWAALIGWAMSDSLAMVRFGAGLGAPLLGAFIIYSAQPERTKA